MDKKSEFRAACEAADDALNEYELKQCKEFDLSHTTENFVGYIEGLIFALDMFSRTRSQDLDFAGIIAGCAKRDAEGFLPDSGEVVAALERLCAAADRSQS